MDEKSIFFDKELIDLFWKYIRDQKTIPNELIQGFVLRTKKLISYGSVGQVDENFDLLSEYINSYWRSGAYSESVDPTFNFQMGQLLSCITMINISMKEDEERFSSLIDSKYYERYSDFFDAINSEPGINHSKLAAVLGKHVSRISQITLSLKSTGLFVERKKGREKFYYLTKKGEMLLDSIEKQDKNDLISVNRYYSDDSYWSPYFKEVESIRDSVDNFLSADERLLEREESVYSGR